MCDYPVVAGVACFYPSTGGLQYSVTSQEDTGRGLRLHLASSGQSPFGRDFRRPVLDVHMVSNNLLRFTVSQSSVETVGVVNKQPAEVHGQSVIHGDRGHGQQGSRVSQSSMETVGVVSKQPAEVHG